MRTDLCNKQILYKSIRIVLLSLLVSSCSLFSIGKRGVSFNEMGKTPVISTFDNGFEIMTENSIQNSALSIYKITARIDTTHKKIELKGYQALNKKYQNSFKIKVRGISKTRLANFEFYWIDPDQKESRLTIRK